MSVYQHKNTISNIKFKVKQLTESDFTGHGYWHSFRVVKLALKIAKQESADLKVVELAAWLHDIAVPCGRKNHHIKGSRMAGEILLELNVPKNIIKQVKSCVLKHRYSKKYKLNTIEEKVIQDADNLDALGAIIIPRIFAHCGAHKIPIYNPNIKPSKEHYIKTGRSTTGINHIYEKLFDIPNCLHTKTAKTIANSRLSFLKIFLKQYLDEFQGKK